jgi:segregation and condensation protein B
MNESASDIWRALEVILFATSEPVSSYQIARLLEEEGWSAGEGKTTPLQVERWIEQLIAEWEEADKPFTVLKIAGGYQMATRPEWSGLVAKLQEDKRSQRLSRAALETLAIVAYRQPVIRPDIDAIRGVNSDSALKTLLERNLVAISGRDEGPGRPLLYRTTPQFLKYFGLNNVNDLPDPSELASLLGISTGEPRADSPGEVEDLFSTPAEPGEDEPGESSGTADSVQPQT